MTTEPERPIEELLRAAAKKRREEAGAPLVLHPATRRMLQGEVARQFGHGQGRTEPFWLVLTRCGPRLAWGAAIVCSVVVMAVLLVPAVRRTQKEALLARHQSGAEPRLTSQQSLELAAAPLPAPPPAASSAGGAALADSGREQPAPRLESNQAEPTKGRAVELSRMAAAKQMAPAAPPASRELSKAERSTVSPSSDSPQAPTQPSETVAFSERYGLAHSASGSTAAAVASAPPPAAFLTAGKDSLASVPFASQQGNGPGLSQHFQQVPQETKRSVTEGGAPAQPVLNSFRVEQSGPELRIVDRDGSVYSGSLQLADSQGQIASAGGQKPALTRSRPTPALEPNAQPVATLGANPQAWQNYTFQVAGTNRSLNKKVVFTGNLATSTNLTLVSQVTNSVGQAAPGVQASSTVQNVQVLLLNSRISGKAVIGGRREVEIDALPASP